MSEKGKYREEFIRLFDSPSEKDDFDVFDLTNRIQDTTLPRFSEEELRKFEMESEEKYTIHVSRFRKITETLPRLDFELLMETIFDKIRKGLPCPPTVEELVNTHLDSIAYEYRNRIKEFPGNQIFVAKAAANFGYNFSCCKTCQDVRDELRSHSKKLY